MTVTRIIADEYAAWLLSGGPKPVRPSDPTLRLDHLAA